MSVHANQFLIRAKDVSLIIAIMTLVGMVFHAYQKPAKWDLSSEKVEKLEVKIAGMNDQLIIVDSRYQAIDKRLERIENNLYALRRENR